MLSHRVRAFVAAAAIPVAFLAACKSTTTVDQGQASSGPAASPTTAAAAPTTADANSTKFGDWVTTGDWQVKVVDVKDPFESTNNFVTPESGTRWVAVDTIVKNNSAEQQTVSSLMCFELEDSQGQKYDIVFTAENVQMPDGDVAPGATLRGTLTYKVPTGVKNLTLRFRGDLLAKEWATIAVS